MSRFKLAVMRILMTSPALILPTRRLGIARSIIPVTRMAPRTLQGLMRSIQAESKLRMQHRINTPHSFIPLHIGSFVAVLAIGSNDWRNMRTFMTVHTRAPFNGAKGSAFKLSGMTGRAACLCVSPLKNKEFGMVEIRSRNKRLLIMAIRAGAGFLRLMNILMTGYAALIQSKEGR